MKYFLYLLSATFLGLMAFSFSEGTALQGKVTDSSGEALIGAAVKVMKGAELVRATVTDVEGVYRLALDPGTYDLEFAYTGYETQRIVGVQVLANTINTLDAKLAGGAVLNEVVVTSYKVPLVKADKTESGMTLTSDEIRPLSRATDTRTGSAKAKKATPTRRATPPASKPETKALGDDVKIRGARSKDITYYIDGIRVTDIPASLSVDPGKIVMPTEAIFISDDLDKEAPTPPTSPGTPAVPAPRAGLLTAGEWNDLHNWNTHWVDLLKDGEIDEYQKMYGFYPKQHFTVLLTNEQDIPLVDVPVALMDRWGAAVWQGRTDNTGKAELWAELYNAKSEPKEYQAIAIIDGANKTLGKVKPAEEGLNRFTVARACGHSKNVDIVWAVDATGSMGDELEYLKTELLDVIGRVQAANPELAVRMGSVFYRDKGDDYIVKSSALNYDIAKTVAYIQQQSAGGGGDYPEAVHSALEEAIYRQPWSAEAVTRICFLVLDASPHREPEVIASLQKSIREAAQKGIRIVPVSASGVQKDTEFLMKFFGLATNGSYVFLTDHSGIGGKHLAPTTDEYKVEALNALLVRLITEYCTVESCDGKVAIRFEDQQRQPGQPEQPTQQALYYPNPAVSQFSLDLPFEAQKVTLYDAEGKAVHQLTQLGAGIHSIPVHQLPAGMYTLRIWKDGQVQSGKVMVVRS
ncbi:MAG: carboxypeptidase regulatory-like domain-containing protein [Saprospiraceae bacterium]|nr:carboxypeptidase regulatory-like domain-containing protein [Saprospiraceae bacterium]